MRIAVDLTSLTDRWSGLERCAYELTAHMIARAGEDRFILIVKNTPPERVRALGRDPRVSFIRLHSGNKLAANELKLPYAVAAAKADAAVFPVFPMPLLLPLFCPETAVYGVVADTVCFDVPETMRFWQRIFWRVGLKSEAAHASGIITVSDFSAERIRKNLGVPEEKLLVAPNGVKCGAAGAADEKAREETLLRYGIRQPYLLTLSTREPRKDLPLLIRSYRAAREDGVCLPQLVIAGRSGWMDDTESLADSGILFTDFIREEDLAEVYAGAEAFLFPSYYEGFGLPPLEALACGVRRILVSDAPALREVMGDTAVYFRRRDPDALREMLSALGNGELPAADEDTAREHLKRFSWESSADKVLKMLHEGRNTD